MLIKVQGENPKKIKFSGTVKDLFIYLKLNKDIFLTVKKGELLTEDDTLKDTDEVELLKIISGG